MTTGYILVGLTLEERDLVSFFGNTYREYREAVPALIPFTRFRRARKEKTV
jgi:protein-S-isoprenylcysteine O-methyltransferase Ste14